MTTITCFKAYDIRGRVPEQLNEDVAYRVGYAFVVFLNAKKIVVGHDVRLTSDSLAKSLMKGMTDAGASVWFLGECGTEEVYFGTFHLNADGGVCVTASHNPMDYNGMKLVGKGSTPISGDTGLNEIKLIAETASFVKKEVGGTGHVKNVSIREPYIQHLLSYIDVQNIKPLKVVVNAGNGGAGAIIDLLEPHLPISFIKIHHEANGHFPNGIPNPLLPEKRQATIDAVKKHKANFGIAWDGDFDRCFFFDEHGCFIEGYYLVGVLAEAFLLKNEGAKIVHDPRLMWNTVDIVKENGGDAIQSRTGHAFIKQKMREVDAVYGGEMSAHHYFKKFAYCDNGNIPWLLVAELLSIQNTNLSSLVAERMEAFPCSGEINARVTDPKLVLKSVEEFFLKISKELNDPLFKLECVDGLSIAFSEWRFNLRMSSTEPVIRLNVESRKNRSLMEQKTNELLILVEPFKVSS